MMRNPFLLMLWVWVLFPLTQLQGNTAPSLSTSLPGEKPKLGVTLTADHFPSLREDLPSLTNFYLDVNYPYLKGHQLRLLQGATKKYEINSIGEEEFSLSDLYLYYYYTLSEDFHSLKVKLRGTLTFSLSETSRHEEVISRPSLQVEFSRKFMGEKLSVSYRPYVTFHMGRYTTSLGGDPLKTWSLGHILNSTYEILPRFKAGLYLLGVFHFLHRAPSAETAASSQGAYEFDAYLAYEFSPLITARLGVNQSDSMFRQGRYEIYLYDPANTRVYLGLDVSL